MCMSVLPICMTVHQMHVSVIPSESGAINACESPCGWVLGINPGSLSCLVISSDSTFNFLVYKVKVIVMISS